MTTTFTPRPFPPPALAGVPLEYIINQLHHLAPHYWTKPETADCTIIVPHDLLNYKGNSQCPPLTPGINKSAYDPSGMGRRVTEPNLRMPPRTTMKLHMDYLSAQSSLFRGLFSGASPLDLISSAFGSSRSPAANSLRQWVTPPHRVPHSLPSSPSHPVIFLPLPDPSSFSLLVHWMYFGKTKQIEAALESGAISWEGLARNVEYLDIRDDMRLFLGKWYRKWHMHGLACPPVDIADDDDSESDVYDSDEDDLFSSTPSLEFDTETDADIENESSSEEEEDKIRKHGSRPQAHRTIQKCSSSPDTRAAHLDTVPPRPPRPNSQ